MKRKIVKIMMTAAALIALTAGTTKTTMAQIRVGVQVGANLANLSGSDVTNNSVKVGVNGGVFVRLGLSDQFSIQPALLYSMKGAKFKDDSLTSNFNSNYLEIPINARYQFSSDGGFNVFLGPYVGILMSAKQGDVDVKSFENTTDFGLNVGLGYELEGGFGISAQYGLGFANIEKSVDVLGTSTSPSVKNAVIGINLSYAFGGKK